MPSPSPTPTEETSQPPDRSSADEPNLRRDDAWDTYDRSPPDPDAPVSFVPHVSVQSTARLHPLPVRAGRYGDLEEHELVHLLDTMEDERARARFRESVYLSVFVWMALALLALYGPKYLWHAPKLTLPSEVLRQREITTLVAPSLTAPRVRSSPPPSIDSRTLEHLRSAAPRTPVAPAPQPEQPSPRPSAVPTRPLPPAPTANLQPSTAPPNVPMPSAPTPVLPRTPPPAVADAPRPQPTARPNFGGVPQSAADSIQQAIHSATRGGGGGGGGNVGSTRGGTSLGLGGAEILSPTQGVNFNPYLQRILREIYDQWIPLIPEEAKPPLRKSGVTQIRFTILPDGNIGTMKIDGSTHDDALNRAAWGSILGVNQFPPLPSQFHGPNLELRIHYLVNQDTE